MQQKFYPIRLSELWYFDKKECINLFSDKDLRLINFKLNDIGSYIWKRCEGELSNEDIALQLYEELDGIKPSKAEIISDVNNYLIELKNNGLVNWEGEETLDVLFIIPPFPLLYSSKAITTPEYSAPPLGISYVAAVLKKNNYHVGLFDMHIKALQPEDIIKEYRISRPKIVAITVTTPTFPNAILVAKLLKAWDKTVIIIFGGPHATCLPDECINSKAVDFVIIGEGEISTLELVNTLIRREKEIEELKGIVYKDNHGKTKFTLPQISLIELDTLPYPARELLDLDSYYQKGSIISTRGCPYDCNYCACAAISGHTYRKHSVDYVLNEIEFLIKEYNITYFDFHDDTFNLLQDRVFEFCNKIAERNLNIKWGCFCRVSPFSLEMAKAMKKAGCEVIQFGIESGNQKILNSIKKKITLREVENAVKFASQAGIKQIACGFIIGHSDETEETAFQTIDFGVKLTKIGATNLSLSVLTPYPGTEIYSKMGTNGITLITKDWENFIFSRVVIETKNLSKEKLREIYAKGVYSFLESTISK